MMDLERVLPTGVQVTSIEPVITPDGDVNIRLRVTGDRDRTVEFVRNLEQSQRFLQPRLANETAQTQEQGRAVSVGQQAAPGGVEFDILSGYNPLPEPSKEKKQPPPDGTDAAGASKPIKPATHKTTAPNKVATPKAATPGGAR
jgi:type IV pilus assembly protein PilN